MASGFFFETTRSTWETMSSCEVVSFRGRGVGRLKEVMGHDVKSLHSEVAEGRKGTGMLVEIAGHMVTGARHLKCWILPDGGVAKNAYHRTSRISCDLSK